MRVFAPATVANVCCGFDVFGFALCHPGDEVQISLHSHNKKEAVIRSIKGDGGLLPYDPLKNSASVSVLALLAHLNLDGFVEIEIEKKMPLGSGLGSSAASAAAAVFGLNALLGFPLKKELLIPFAMEGEKACCGTAHADNVAPALLGGFTVIRSYSPLEVLSIPCHLPLYCSVLHPRIEILTTDARAVLPQSVSLQQLVKLTGNVAAVIAALMQADAALLSRALEDTVIEKVRAPLIPGYYSIKNSAIEAGALACGISGSGPSIFALSLSKEKGEAIGDAMVEACNKNGMAADLYVSELNPQGAIVIDA